MNILVAKRAILFSLILGAMIGLLSLIPMLIGYMLLILVLFSSIIVIMYMKRNDKYLGIINTEQGAILGGFIGFFSTLGFFITFCPMVCILKLIFTKYYAYTIPDMVQTGLWLLFVIVLMVALIIALINSTMGMGLAWVLNYIEKKPENLETKLDIKIED